MAIYEVIMSKGEKIRIDEADLQHIRENIASSLIKVKQGIINPSFMVMIKPTEEADQIVKPILERVGENTARIVGQEKIPKLADLMSPEVKKLN